MVGRALRLWRRTLALRSGRRRLSLFSARRCERVVTKEMFPALVIRQRGPGVFGLVAENMDLRPCRFVTFRHLPTKLPKITCTDGWYRCVAQCVPQARHGLQHAFSIHKAA